MAWFCAIIKFILLMVGSVSKLCGEDDSESSLGAPCLYNPPAGNAGLFPALTSIDESSNKLPASIDDILTQENKLLTSTYDMTTPTDVSFTSSADTPNEHSATTPSDNLLTPSDSSLSPSDVLPSSSPNVSNESPASSSSLTSALQSDLDKNTVLSKVIKATGVAPLLRFVQAIEELNLTRVGDYDEKTQELIKNNFALNKKEKYMNTSQLIQTCGRRVEEYTVKTPDGYFLKLFRIPSSGLPVLIMHGLLSSSDDFLGSGCKNSLPYVVSNQGYDVWFGNARGNKYSQRHETLNPDRDLEFWNFSWHEIGVTDLPTIIDFILIYTTQPKLLYVGHSQGTTSAFVLLSERPEYNDKLHLMVALSPVAWMGNLFSPFLQISSQFVDEADFLEQAFGSGQFVVGSEVSVALRTVVCSTSPTAAAVCDPIVSSIFGFSPAHKDFEYLPVQTEHFFSSTSTKQVTHYLQEIRSYKFQQFDYEEERNREMYGSPTPPEYPVHRISAPVALFYSSNDWVSAVEDVERLISQLGNSVVYANLLQTEYSHMDYLWARDAIPFVYSPMLNLFKQFSRAPEDYFADN